MRYTHAGLIASSFIQLAVQAPFAAAEPVINEFVLNHTGTDTSEYVEVFGAADTSYAGLHLLEVEGDSTGAGTVDGVLDIGQTDSGGLWVTPFLANALENGTLTLLLVENFTGAVGDDLDTDNDGNPDLLPWDQVIDAVAVTDGGSSDRTYASVVLAPDFDGVGFGVGGASRIPDGTDTDAVGDWIRNDFDLAGIMAGTPEPGEALNTPGAANALTDSSGGESGSCGDPAVQIGEIQGTGLESALQGAQNVEAVVTAVMPGLGGFYLQEEGAGDGDAATSDGIFVYLGEAPPATLQPGDLVRVRGTVEEFQRSGTSQTQLSGSPVVLECGTATPIAATEVSFPLADPNALERFEGMLVVLPQELVIGEYFNFDRFGEVVVSLPPNGWERLYTPTAVVEPGDTANELTAEYQKRWILIDDGRSSQNPDPAIHPGNGAEFTLDNRFRGGDVIMGIQGVIDHTFGRYRLQPTTYGAFWRTNFRPLMPADVGGNVRVGSLNVLNYFLTLDQGQDSCGPNRDVECRGADTGTELARQRAKIIDALIGLNADIVGLIELENTSGVEPVADLVAGLNDQLGAGTYAFVETGLIGTDAIRVGLIYKPDTVQPVGDFAVLDASVDPRFLDDKNRPVLAQTFEKNGRRVTVAVNHLKSKGSACDDVGDPDAGDGQGNCNGTRALAAQAMADWLAREPTGAGTGAALIIGDLNSYDNEDPIGALRAAGYTDLLAQAEGELAYSYVFDGQFGYLDYAMANPQLIPQVTGATSWHINADEPDILDYDTTFKADAQDALYQPNPFRASDHDAVVVGLDLQWPIPATKEDCKNGGWRTLYRSDGSSFEDQGLCIRYVLTRR